jgi:hypothetical protein
MGVNWKEVETLVKPSPSYEDIIKRILEIFSYDFVDEYYNHTMEEAEIYVVKLLGSDPKKRYKECMENLTKAFRQLDSLNMQTYVHFVQLEIYSPVCGIDGITM